MALQNKLSTLFPLFVELFLVAALKFRKMKLKVLWITVRSSNHWTFDLLRRKKKHQIQSTLQLNPNAQPALPILHNNRTKKSKKSTETHLLQPISVLFRTYWISGLRKSLALAFPSRAFPPALWQYLILPLPPNFSPVLEESILRELLRKWAPSGLRIASSWLSHRAPEGLMAVELDNKSVNRGGDFTLEDLASLVWSDDEKERFFKLKNIEYYLVFYI